MNKRSGDIDNLFTSHGIETPYREFGGAHSDASTTATPSPQTDRQLTPSRLAATSDKDQPTPRSNSKVSRLIPTIGPSASKAAVASETPVTAGRTENAERALHAAPALQNAIAEMEGGLRTPAFAHPTKDTPLRAVFQRLDSYDKTPRQRDASEHQTTTKDLKSLRNIPLHSLLSRLKQR